MTDLWYRELHPHWQKTPMPIVGLTAHGPLFCLERLAWDHRMRVVFRAEHEYRGDGCVEHRVSAPDDVLPAATDLAAAGADWGVQAARLVSRCVSGRPRASETIVTRLAQAVSINHEPMFSWVIAPVEGKVIS